MDFHSLTRRELQTLCKKNKIPANVTNVAMADALVALEIVEGIEEFLNPSQSETAQSSVESPEKMEVTSPCVPRTGGRTTRRKTVKDQVENSETSTRARRSTRKLVVGEADEKQNKVVETPAATNTRRAQAASVRRKMDTQLKEVEKDQKIEKEISETPGVLPGSLRRGLKGESTVRRVYGTRRSTRLAEKNMGNAKLKENENLESVKGELFSEESGENLEIMEMNVNECSNDLGEIIESTDIDLTEQLEKCLERNNDKDVDSDKKSDCLIENEIQFESNLDRESSEGYVVVRSEMKIEEDAVEGNGCDVEDKAADDLKAEVHSEICEETDPSTDISDKPLEMANVIEKHSGGSDLYLTKTEDVLENAGDKLDANGEMVSQNIAAEIVEEVTGQDDAFTTDNKTLEMSEEIIDFIQEGAHDLPVTDEVLETADDKNDMGFKVGSVEKVLENANSENDMGTEDGFVCDLDEANWYSEDLAAFDNTHGGVEKESGKSSAEESLVIHSKAEEQGVWAEESLVIHSKDGEQGIWAEQYLMSHSKPEEQGMDLIAALESMTLEKTDSLADESINYKLIEENVSLELNASADVFSGIQPKERANSSDVVGSEKAPPKELGILGAFDGLLSYNALPVPAADNIGDVSISSFAADHSKILSTSAETDLSHTVSPTCLTPSKKSAGKTPTKKSASKKTLNHVFDDKENIDSSGIKLILTTEKKIKDVDQPQYADYSLRKLKKEVKLKEEMSKNLKKNEHVSSRPALQAVPENVIGE